MKECPNCKTQLEENAVFCCSCGVKLNAETATTCKNCGQNLQPGSEVCHNCGVVVGAPNPQPQADYAETQNTYEEPVKPKKKRKGLKLLLGIGLPVIAVLLAGVIVLDLVFGWGLLFGKKSTNPNIFYIKDGEVMGVNSSMLDDPFEVVGVNNEDTNFALLAYSADGSKMYYVDDYEREDNKTTNTFYWRETDAPEKEATKIDIDVVYFLVSEDGDTVVYTKSTGTTKRTTTYDDGEEETYTEETYAIYSYDLNSAEKEKVANDTERMFYISSSGKKILYGQEKGVFVKNGDEKAEKICENDTKLVYMSQDFETIYYINYPEKDGEKDRTNGALYKKEIGKSAEKISSGVCGCPDQRFTEEKFYFYKSGKQTSLYDTLVKDDNKEEDEKLTEVTMPYYEPTVPTRYYYESDESYKIRYDNYVNEVNEYNERIKQYNAYQKKVARDEVRETLALALDDDSLDLYYYDGSKEVLVKENVTGVYLADKKNVGGITCLEVGEVEKIDVTALADNKDVESIVDEKVEELKKELTKNYIIDGAKATKWDDLHIRRISIDPNGECGYIITDYDSEKKGGELYKVKVSDGSKEHIDDNVYSVDCYSADLYTYKKYIEKENEEDETEYEFYINGDQIDINVEDVSYIEETKELYFLADVTEHEDEDRYYSDGTLKVYKDGKAEKIADDVYEYYVTNTNELYYLADYDGEEGELYYYDGEKQKIDEEVSDILIPFMDVVYRCDYNFFAYM